MSSIQNNTLHPTQMVTLRSREFTQRLNGEDNSDILFQLDQVINVPPNVDIYVTLQVFRFVNGMYNIPNSSHILYWRSLKSGVWNDHSLTVPIGNWNIDDLIVYLNGNQSPKDITFSYNAKTFKVKAIHHTGSTTSIELLTLPNNINARLGFSETETTVIPTGVDGVTSPNLIDLLGTQNVYINIDDLQLSSVSTIGFGHKSVLDHVAVIVPQGTGQTHSGNGLMLKCGVQKITQMRVQLFTGEDRLAELNNTEWYMSLLFNFQYENEYRPPRYLTDVNGDGRIDMQDLIALFSQQQQQQGNTL
jgi:hypothetical protein